MSVIYFVTEISVNEYSRKENFGAILVGMQEDAVDRHIAHWRSELDDLDPVVEGVTTRMQMLVRHLNKQRQNVIEQQGMEKSEFETLHMLAGCLPDYRATPTEIASWLRMSPAAITGRIDALERQGYVARAAVAGDRRKVMVQLTEAGHARWIEGLSEVGAEEDRIAGALQREELEQLNGYLRRMLQLVDEEAPTPLTT
jgi:DNA-binding MarR family transcriptional regulator